MDKESEFTIPENTLGLHILREPEKNAPRVDIVAVHGLGGDAFATWTDRKSGCLWLKDLLPMTGLLADARIMTFGYDSRAFIRPFSKYTKGRTFTFAETLLNDLTDYRADAEPRRPIVFIGHSLGGIVIKSALCHAHDREQVYGDILNSTHSIVFFGTPHQGADIATWATYLGMVGKVLGVQNTKVTKELERWSDPLVELTVAFSGHANKFQITTFFETLPLNGVIVVPEGSARIGLEGERYRGLDGDHRSICKFSTADVQRFQPVRQRFLAIMQTIARQIQVSELGNAPNAVSQQNHQQGVGQEDQQLENWLQTNSSAR